MRLSAFAARHGTACHHGQVSGWQSRPSEQLGLSGEESSRVGRGEGGLPGQGQVPGGTDGTEGPPRRRMLQHGMRDPGV